MACINRKKSCKLWWQVHRQARISKDAILAELEARPSNSDLAGKTACAKSPTLSSSKVHTSLWTSKRMFCFVCSSDVFETTTHSNHRVTTQAPTRSCTGSCGEAAHTCTWRARNFFPIAYRPAQQTLPQLLCIVLWFPLFSYKTIQKITCWKYAFEESLDIFSLQCRLLK